jgi:hypothetical protein
MQIMFVLLHRAGGSAMGLIGHMRAALVAASMIAAVSAARAGDGDREVWVNGLRMSADQILLLEQAFGFCVEDGAYRYDPVNGDLRAIGLSALASPAGEPQYAHAADRADEKTAAYR